MGGAQAVSHSDDGTGAVGLRRESLEHAAFASSRINLKRAELRLPDPGFLQFGQFLQGSAPDDDKGWLCGREIVCGIEHLCAVAGNGMGEGFIQIEATAALQFLDENGNKLEGIDAVEGETIEFVVVNTAGSDHNFWIGTPDELQVMGGETDTGIETWQNGEQTLTWTVPAAGGPLQFACTVPGHYSLMNGDIVISS